MGSHINAEGKFQSDKYPTCPAGKVPLSVTDETAQDLLWQYAQRRRRVDAEFSADLEAALRAAGFVPPAERDDEPETQACEHCDAETPIEELIGMGDCSLCSACHAKWQAEFNACSHEWEESEHEGEPGKLCRKCGGFVLDEDFEAVTEQPAPAGSASA